MTILYIVYIAVHENWNTHFNAEIIITDNFICIVGLG